MEAKTVSLSESRSQKPPMTTKRMEESCVIMGSRSPSGTCPYRCSNAACHSVRGTTPYSRPLSTPPAPPPPTEEGQEWRWCRPENRTRFA